jgi:hypothetical protein
MSRIARSCLVLLTIVAGACGRDPAGPGDPPGGGTGTALEIGPSAVLLTAAGATQQLAAFLVDDAGNRTPVSATFTSSHPGTVSVSAGGLLTAVTGLGSSLIVADAEGLSSPPTLVLVAEPAAGALLVGDEQVDGLPVAVDPNAEYAIGWLERVRLKDVTPTVGQIVLGTGGLPIGGRVTSVSDAGGGTVEIVYALVPISELFAAIAVHESISLANAVTVEDAASTSAQNLGGTVRLTPAEAGQPETKFSLPGPGGPIECEAKFQGTLAPVTLDFFSFDITPDLTVDLRIDGLAVQRVVAHGTLATRVSVNPVLKAGMKGSFECKYLHKTIILPIGGPVSRILGGQVKLGLGFAVEATTQLGDFGVDAFFDGSVTLTQGFDCSAGCEAVADASTTGGAPTFEPIYPSSLDEFKSELVVGLFGWAELTFGNPLIRRLQFEAFEAKAGVQQKAKVATERTQALDAGYQSDFQLELAFEAGTTSKVNALARLLNIQLIGLKFEPDPLMIARSPAGTLTIEPSSVEPGNDQTLGETATFTVTLDPVTYLGFEAVDTVEIRWLRPDGSGGVTLEPGRPGCTRITPIASGQKTFTCETDFLEEHVGVQTFFAFVKPKLFGRSQPISLEIGSATVTVGGLEFTTKEDGYAAAGTNVEEVTPDCEDAVLSEPAPAPPAVSTSLSCNVSASRNGVTGTASAELDASLAVGTSGTTRSVHLIGSGTTSVVDPDDPFGGGVATDATVEYSRDVFFTVPPGQSYSYTLAGTLTVGCSGAACENGGASARIRLAGPAVTESHDASLVGARNVIISRTGTLTEGTYTFGAGAGVDDGAIDGQSQSHTFSYEATLTLTPVP